MIYEVTYFNTRHQFRVKRVDVKNEIMIPFAVRESDREFDSIKNVKLIPNTHKERNNSLREATSEGHCAE